MRADNKSLGVQNWRAIIDDLEVVECVIEFIHDLKTYRYKKERKKNMNHVVIFPHRLSGIGIFEKNHQISNVVSEHCSKECTQ